MSDTQLALPMPLPPLELRPTTAMLAGTQVAHQCAWCGTVVIVPGVQCRTSAVHYVLGQMKRSLRP